MTLTVALDLLLALLARSGEISALISKAHSEGRNNLTPEEWATIVESDDAARTSLEEAIATAKSEGR